MIKLSKRSQPLKQSGIRAASAKCAQVGGVNLGQGICDMPTPKALKVAAVSAIENNHNIYSACEGVFTVRQAIAEKINKFNQIKVDAEKELMITHGSIGAFVCAALSLFNPGDEVILFEPFYTYHKNLLESFNIVVKGVPINMNDLSLDLDLLSKAINANTKAILICTPSNPSGKIFTQEELLSIGEIVVENDLLVITDEIYEYITFPGYQHVSFASLNDYRNRTITISGFSKTFNMTGWRIGYASGPANVIEKMALFQDLIYICPVTPLQYAVKTAFDFGDDYYQNLRSEYLQKRDFVVDSLRNIGFKVPMPQGSYYVMADFSNLGWHDDQEACDLILNKCKVATVPGRAFYINPADGKHYLRICFGLDEAKLQTAMQALKTLV